LSVGSSTSGTASTVVDLITGSFPPASLFPSTFGALAATSGTGSMAFSVGSSTSGTASTVLELLTDSFPPAALSLSTSVALAVT
jgi:hypothetical protein